MKLLYRNKTVKAVLLFFKKNIVKIKLRNVFFICSALLFCFFVRYEFNNDYHVGYIFPDTYHYTARADEITKGLPLINPFRMPLYPILLIQTQKMPFFSTKYEFLDFRKYFPDTITFQYQVDLIGCILFIGLCFYLFRSTASFLIACLYFALNIHIFGWVKNVIPETITQVGMLGFLASVILYLEIPKWKYFLILIIVSILLFLCRPVYFLLPLSVVPLFAYYFMKKKNEGKAVWTTIFLFLFLVVPLYYSLVNYRLFNFFGMSTVSNHNLFGKIIQYKLDINGITDDARLTSELQKCTDSYNLGDWVDITSCEVKMNVSDNDPYMITSSKIVGNLATRTIKKQPIVYVLKSIALFPEVLTTVKPNPILWINTYSPNALLQKFWERDLSFYDLLHPITLFFYPLSLLSFIFFIRLPSKKNFVIASMATFIWYQMFFSAFFSPSDYIRLRSPIEAILILFMFYYARLFVIGSRKLISALSKKETKTKLHSVFAAKLLSIAKTALPITFLKKRPKIRGK